MGRWPPLRNKLFVLYCIVLYNCFIIENTYTAETTYTHLHTVKPVLCGHSKIDQKFGFKTNYPLMQVKSIAEC